MDAAIDYDSVADLCDVYVRVELDLPFFLKEARAAGGVLEVMAGSGRVSLPLAAASIPLTCVDYSAGLLGRLRQKLARAGLRAETHLADARTFDLGRTFALAFVAFNAFSELLTAADQTAALERVRRHLAPGGRLVCTLHNPTVRSATLDGQEREVGRFPLGAGELRVLSAASWDPATRLATGHQTYRELDSDGSLRAERKLPVRFRLPAADELARLAAETGFRIQQVYGDYSCGASRLALPIARKRAAASGGPLRARRDPGGTTSARAGRVP